MFLKNYYYKKDKYFLVILRFIPNIAYLDFIGKYPDCLACIIHEDLGKSSKALREKG